MFGLNNFFKTLFSFITFQPKKPAGFNASTHKIPVCQTPGAIFHISIKPRSVRCMVSLPIDLNITEDRAIQLENQIHDAFEDILKEFFIQKQPPGR